MTHTVPTKGATLTHEANEEVREALEMHVRGNMAITSFVITESLKNLRDDIDGEDWCMPCMISRMMAEVLTAQHLSVSFMYITSLLMMLGLVDENGFTEKAKFTHG